MNIFIKFLRKLLLLKKLYLVAWNTRRQIESLHKHFLNFARAKSSGQILHHLKCLLMRWILNRKEKKTVKNNKQTKNKKTKKKKKRETANKKQNETKHNHSLNRLANFGYQSLPNFLVSDHYHYWLVTDCLISTWKLTIASKWLTVICTKVF